MPLARPSVPDSVSIAAAPTKPGFSLVELLIVLGILGLLAVFTIPKILGGQDSHKKNALAKDAAMMVQAAYNAYLENNAATASVTFDALTPYMQYVSRDTSGSTINGSHGGWILTCNNNYSPCLRLKNGATLAYRTGISFGGTAVTNALRFFVDPDSAYQDDDNAAAAELYLYHGGRISSRAFIIGNTCNTETCVSKNDDVPWLKWQP